MRPRVLVIDDDDDIRQLIAIMLESKYDVAQAADGQQGLSLLAVHPVDLVILDVMMPGMTGWEVCRNIKSQPTLQHIPVIIVTVRSQLVDEATAVAVQADGYLRKPFDLQELLDIVAQTLATRAASS